ncbi:MAG: hypothetical protein AVDCRST_MAG11-3627 [uncultured Gemmatimonadaceae bacterium]|uniref:Uncharacterized protein n=1 Tax=uncultured Gemmatimonadaceae bacterium TaxID=246130 RepID=A0A6J4M8B6_9BACT|nr:MAG: hypothetical protein AVDCRST_MAG11-3627 [uncultured Gemmatimonadaceae bacterium]
MDMLSRAVAGAGDAARFGMWVPSAAASVLAPLGIERA